MPASFAAEIVIQTGTTSVPLVMPGGLLAGDMAVAFIANKLDSATVATPDDWESLGSSVVGTGVAGLDTGPLRVSAFWRLLTQDTIANPSFAVAGGNVSMGYGQVYRKASGEVWRAPTATFGTDATHDLTWGTTGSANLSATVADFIAVISAGTANTGPTGRTVTMAGTTGTVTGINSAGTATGNHLFIWGERYEVLTGTSSGGPVSAGSHAANQSGGAGFVRLGVTASGFSVSNWGRGLKYHMNRKAGTLVNDQPTVEAKLAANIWAGTTDRPLVGALNTVAGNTFPQWKELQGVLNQLAGTSGLAIDGAAASIP